MQDITLIDEMAHFDRERIPERVVHAKGAGAFGYFETTHNISKYTKACVFDKIGKKTPIGVRFSTVGGESGSADTARDPRGFAVKFYTEQGVWDIVGNNTPIFFIRDPIFVNFLLIYVLIFDSLLIDFHQFHKVSEFHSHSIKKSSYSFERCQHVLGFHYVMFTFLLLLLLILLSFIH